MVDEKYLRQIKLQVQLKEKQIENVKKEESSIVADIHLLSEIVERLNRNEVVPIDELQRAGIGAVSVKAYSTAVAQTDLRIRVQSAKILKESKLNEKNRELSILQDSLKMLSRCPECNGEGMQVVKRYQREAQEGRVQDASVSEICAFCAGHGKLPL